MINLQIDLENQLREELYLCQARLARLQDIEAVCRTEFVEAQRREEQIHKHLAYLYESQQMSPSAFVYQPPEIDIWTQYGTEWQ